MRLTEQAPFRLQSRLVPDQISPGTGTPKGVSRVVAGDKIEAGLESTDGTLLDHLEHVVKDREGGYQFKAK